VTKNPRDPRVWTNMEIARDAQGYLAAQDAFRADRDAAQLRRREVDALNRFTESFVRAGGQRSDAEEAFWSQRNTEALQSARTADDQARAEQRRHVRQGL
jgi:hypothetical protein